MKKVKYIEEPNMIDARKRRNNICTVFYSNNVSIYLKKNFENKSYFIKTHGCQANLRDEETFKGILNSFGMKEVLDIKKADLILINTCAVRENANDKVYAEIGNIKHLKAKNKDLILIVAGCMVETTDTLNKLINTYSHIDILLGTHNIKNLANDLETYLKEKNVRIVDVSSKEGEIVEDLPSSRNNSFSAFVNITFGCDKFCSYCIVPFTRGKERSRSLDDILKECKLLKKEGYLEVTLLGQNVDSYGKDLNPQVSFAKVLESVAELGFKRVRFLTSYPSDFKDDVIEVIARNENIMKYIHLPIQSGSDAILKRMNRRYTSKEYLDLVTRIRNKIPNIALSTDIIIGFPQESDEEAKESLEFISKIGYSSAFTFIYSKREGTIAAKIDDKVPYEKKVERFKAMQTELEKSFYLDNQKHIGKVEEVLVVGTSKTNKEALQGILENNKTVNFIGPKSLIGTIVKVKLTENKTYAFKGELVE